MDKNILMTNGSLMKVESIAEYCIAEYSPGPALSDNRSCKSIFGLLFNLIFEEKCN